MPNSIYTLIKRAQAKGKIQKEKFEYYINGKDVGTEFFHLKDDGVHQIYYDGEIIEETKYFNQELHGIERDFGENGIITHEIVWYQGRAIGNLEDVVKEKGKLWFLITFGEVV